MVVTFNEDYLEKLYANGETGIKKLRFQPQIVRGYQKAIKYLIQAKRKEDLFPFKSLHFEALHGDKEGRFSVKANDQYRVEFTVTETEDEPVVTICNIMELSNHYKLKTDMDTTQIMENRIANNMTSSMLIHPGEMIKDEIIARGMTQKELAKQMGVSYTVFNEILNGKRPVTTEYALLLEAALGTKASIWIGLQADYNMQKAKQDKSFMKRLEKIRKIAAIF